MLARMQAYEAELSILPMLVCRAYWALPEQEGSDDRENSNVGPRYMPTR